MNASFSVCMMLEAVNRMGPSLNSAMQQVNQLKRQLGSIPKNVTSTVKIKRIEETVKKMRESASRSNSRALEDGATGAALMAPVVKTVKDFAEAEDGFTALKIAAYDSSIPVQKMQEELKKATIEAQRLGDMTRFSTREAYDSMTTLTKGGAALKDVYSGLGQAALYLAQAGGVDVNQSAEAMVKISNAYQLGGEQMKGVADMINRVDGASTASVESLQIGFKYAAGAAAQIGQSVNETAQALAVLNNRGLDGSTAGTNYADMMQRLIPQTKQQTAYMQKLEWVRDDGSSVFFDTDTGKLKSMMEVIGIMRSSFAGLRSVDKNILFDDSGQQLRSLDEVKEMLGSNSSGMKAYEQLKYMHKIFGEQGGRAAMAIMQTGKGSWEEVGGNIAKAMPLDQRIGVQSKTLAGRFENMMGSMQNLSADSGSPVGNFLSERLDGITEMINATRKWAAANPEVVKSIMWIVTSLGMLKLGSMVFHLMKSGALGLAGDLLSVVGGLGKVKNGLGILTGGYKAARLTGLGFGKSSIKGMTDLWPWFGKISGGVGRLGGVLSSIKSKGKSMGQSIAGGAKTGLKGMRSLAKIGTGIGKAMGRDTLTAITTIGKLGKAVGIFSAKWTMYALRIAAGWLIAMGPPGWIILGVTALIIAGVAAWKTNFMGFRDKCISVWNAISDWGKRTWDNITGFVQAAIRWCGGFIERMKEALGLAGELDNRPHTWGPIKGAELGAPRNTPVQVPALPFQTQLNLKNADQAESPYKLMRSEARPYIIQSTRHEGGGGEFTQHNNFSVKSNDEAISIAQQVVPKRYKGEDNNPKNFMPSWA